MVRGGGKRNSVQWLEGEEEGIMYIGNRGRQRGRKKEFSSVVIGRILILFSGKRGGGKGEGGILLYTVVRGEEEGILYNDKWYRNE